MKTFAITMILTVILGSVSSAQNPPTVGVLGVGPPPVFVVPQPVQAGPLPTPGMPITAPGAGFYKSGGVFIGAGGYFPYDTGNYLLAGSDGLARSSGYFTMVAPPGSDEPAPAKPSRWKCLCKRLGLFKHSQ